MKKLFCMSSYKQGNSEYFIICTNDGLFDVLSTTKLKKRYNIGSIENLTLSDNGTLTVNKQYDFFSIPVVLIKCVGEQKEPKLRKLNILHPASFYRKRIKNWVNYQSEDDTVICKVDTEKVLEYFSKNKLNRGYSVLEIQKISQLYLNTLYFLFYYVSWTGLMKLNWRPNEDIDEYGCGVFIDEIHPINLSVKSEDILSISYLETCYKKILTGFLNNPQSKIIDKYVKYLCSMLSVANNFKLVCNINNSTVLGYLNKIRTIIRIKERNKDTQGFILFLSVKNKMDYSFYLCVDVAYRVLYMNYIEDKKETDELDELDDLFDSDALL